MTKVVNRRNSDFEVCIGRPTPWGNSFSCVLASRAEHLVGTRGETVSAFEDWVLHSTDAKAVWIREHVHELRDKVLGCWCKPLACHGEVLALMADERME